MRVEVRVFGSLKESVSSDAWSLNLPAGANLRALLAEVQATLGDAVYLALTGDNVKIAVNQTLTTDADLSDGDEIAFLPPVTGG